jgi:hypothetical protein
MTDTDNALPKDKTELLARIQGEWAALLKVAEALSAEQMTRRDAGGWSPKDNLAHLTEWERFLFSSQFEEQAAHVALGVDEATLTQPVDTVINALLLERNRNRPVQEVLADLHQTHARLVAALEEASEAGLQTPTCLIGPEKAPVMLWVIYNTYEHYAEHCKTIEASMDVKG